MPLVIPVAFTVLSRVQEYVVITLLGLDTIIGELLIPEQIVWDVVLTVKIGFGFTVTTRVKVFPLHVPELAVMVYVAVLGTLVGFDNV